MKLSDYNEEALLALIAERDLLAGKLSLAELEQRKFAEQGRADADRANAAEALVAALRALADEALTAIDEVESEPGAGTVFKVDWLKGLKLLRDSKDIAAEHETRLRDEEHGEATTACLRVIEGEAEYQPFAEALEARDAAVKAHAYANCIALLRGEKDVLDPPELKTALHERVVKAMAHERAKWVNAIERWRDGTQHGFEVTKHLCDFEAAREVEVLEKAAKIAADYSETVAAEIRLAVEKEPA